MLLLQNGARFMSGKCYRKHEEHVKVQVSFIEAMRSFVDMNLSDDTLIVVQLPMVYM